MCDEDASALKSSRIKELEENMTNLVGIVERNQEKIQILQDKVTSQAELLRTSVRDRKLTGREGTGCSGSADSGFGTRPSTGGVGTPQNQTGTESEEMIHDFICGNNVTRA